MAHVVVEVEVAVLDPVRIVEVERNADELAPQQAGEREAAAHVLAELVERQLVAVVGSGA